MIRILALVIFACRLAAADQPNIILIYTDDHGWPDIGAAGIYPDLKTPHLDALAVSGVRATNGYSSAPQCIPSRAGLLIGKHQNRFGVESNGMSLEGFNAELTIAERVKKVGYATGQIGKWHLGPTNAITDHGFDDVYAKNANRPCAANFTLEGETIPMQQVDDGLYHLDACSQAATTFIRRHSEQPFFLYLAYRAPHVPLDAPQKYLARFPGEMPERRRQALAMISAMDDGVGQIVAELKMQGLTNKTLIWFIGDNGAPLKIDKADEPGGGPGWDGSLNEPMNGEKGMLAEGGIRVPFLVSFPGTIPGEQVYHHPVTALDVAATAVELAGIEAEGLDGVNLAPFLSGEKSGAPHETLTWRWIAQSAIREGKWKLLIGGEREYLFDLDADSGEKTNLLSQQPEIAKRLRDRLTNWADELDPPGLNGEMSTTWNGYFDFYLDGKEPPTRRDANPDHGAVQGWLARGGKLAAKPNGLVVTQAGERRPFIVTSGFKLDAPITVNLSLKTKTGGQVGAAWRCEGQKDFPAGQSQTTRVEGGDDWQEVPLKITAPAKVIHLRLLLPKGETTIRRAALSSESGERLKVWKFGES